MLWNWYTIDACFLTPSWHITTHGAFAATCIGVILLVVALEALRRLSKEYDEHIQRDFAARMSLLANGDAGQPAASSSSSPSPAGPGVCPAAPGAAAAAAAAVGGTAGEALAPQTVTFRASPLQQLVRSVLHAATFGLAYIVMLLAMYYNGYIIICILIGALLGKFLCDWMTKTVVIDAAGSTRTTVANKGGNGGTVVEDPTVCCG